MAASFFICLTVALLVCGLALDVSSLELLQLRAQTAADAAALGAAYEMARGNSGWVVAGQADAALNGFTNGSNNTVVSIFNPPTNGSYSGSTAATQATVTRTVRTSFMALVNSPTAVVQARAVAQMASSPNCLYVMNPAKANAALLSGTINASCGVFVNSNSSSALHLQGGSSLQATADQVVGGYVSSGSVSPTPTTGVKSMTDPLASLTQPVFSSCTSSNITVTSSTGSMTVNPGTYCGGITVSGTVTVTLNPGLYIITGPVSLGGGCTIVGNGVTIFFTSGGGSGFGKFTVNNGVTINLSAPLDSSSGGTPGVVMWGDRNWNDPSQNIYFDSNGFTKLEGYLYFPTTGMIIANGTVQAGSGNYLDIVVDNLTINGGAKLLLSAPDYSQVTGGNPAHIGAGLVE